MQRFIALLRAINVGSHTVKMEHLRTLFESLGFMRVETFIASGNVIFDTVATDTQELEQTISRGLHESLGYEVASFLRSPAELAAVAAYQAFPATKLAHAHALSVAFLPAPPTEAAEHTLLTFQSEVDDFHIQGREVYWLRHTRINESTFSGARLEKALGMPATVRNITTVRRLAAKYPVLDAG